jgi:hypothetical protein
MLHVAVVVTVQMFYELVYCTLYLYLERIWQRQGAGIVGTESKTIRRNVPIFVHGYPRGVTFRFGKKRRKKTEKVNIRE